MNKLKKIKFVLGSFLILISIIGILPILNSSFFNGYVKSYEGATELESYQSKNLLDTNYPILIAGLCLSGTLLILSVKIEK